VAELGIVLVAGDFPRVHAAFLLAAGAAALGRSVVLFGTGHGVRALCADWSGLERAGDDAVVRARGVAGLDELREACRELGVRLIACDSGLRGAAINRAALMAGVGCQGMSSFLEATRQGQLISF
jgi:peroxiredoxin family protein